MTTNLTPEETADRLRMNVRTLANWRIKGYGPKFIKNGSRVLYPVNEVEKWEEQQTVGNTAV